MIYLDNASTTMKKPPEVIEAVVQAMSHIGNASRGTHDEALKASRAVFDTRRKLAKFFHCTRSDHVVFTANSTQALNTAISGLFKPGDHVITTELEHNSVLRPLYRLEDAGIITLSILPADKKGRINTEALDVLFQENTRAVVLTHASNLTGNVVDLEKIGEIAHRHQALLVVDASQTAGTIPIDMEAMQIDVLCFTGHKGLMGPQGTGGLCVREGVAIRPYSVGGTGVQSYLREQPDEMPTKLEAGTLNAHGIAGLSAALDFIEKTGLDAIHKYESGLMRRFYEGVSAIEGVTVYGDFETDLRCAIVSINIRDFDSALVSDALSQDYDIATRPGAHCAPLMHKALGTGTQGAVRFSFSYFNTVDEVDAAIEAVRELASDG